MRIVDRKEFLKLPENTVYSLFAPCVFDGLLIKASPANFMPNDWLYDDLICPVDADSSCASADVLLAADEDSSLSIQMDFNCTGRDGSFDQNQKFAVYEMDDIRGLIARLSDCLVEKDRAHNHEAE